MKNSFDIDNQINVIDRIICRHIDNSEFTERGIVSQDILAQLRNFVEHIMMKFLSRERRINGTYSDICDAIVYVQQKGNLRVLYKFHEFLQIVASHYSLDEENSERLMLKYYEYLLKIRQLLQKEFSMSVLKNLEKFPLTLDPVLQEYYEKISEKIDAYGKFPVVRVSNKYYILKTKPFFVNGKIYYEVTFTPANDYASKTNRVIAFTQSEISNNYAVELNYVSDSIEILDKTMPIMIIVGWRVAIRTCEFNNFTSLVCGKSKDVPKTEQQEFSKFLTQTGYNLSDFLNFSDEYFEKVANQVTSRTKEPIFINTIRKCRSVTNSKSAGENVLRYLLYNLNNKIIKGQRNNEPNDKLSGLYLQNGTIPFDTMPFSSSLLDHNPKLSSLFNCIKVDGHMHELLARMVKNNAEIHGHLFTTVKDIVGFEDIPQLVEMYNSQLWSGHYLNSKLVIENGQIFINGYKNDTCTIIEKLKEKSKTGLQNYSNSVQAWLDEPNSGVDCDEKKKVLLNMFASSHVALVYGSAGTGKSTLINHLAHFFAEKKKLFLAQTHPAVENLKRRVTASKCDFSTIASYIYSPNRATEYDLLVIDECSTVSNNDMKRILLKVNCKVLLLVGDTYQISSIRFGNWFGAARHFVSDSSVFELTTPYRTENDNLKVFWNRVRNMDDNILEFVARQGYSKTLDASIFTRENNDEIILCLNYDGLYGINNINRFLQENNPNPAVKWDVQQYKVGDRILFNESERFAPIIYNNMKGKIVGVKILDEGSTAERIQFDIELEKVLNGMDAWHYDFELLDSIDEKKSIIRFSVNKVKSTDDDDDSTSKAIVPFQVAYAVSIHKAQGLEYDSVKIVITDEVDELITHNIFYTAITRARNNLKIYWTPEVEKKVLSSMQPLNNNKDIHFIKKYIK